jgi:ribosomal protein S18 acetylase RimI-like enzyme
LRGARTHPAPALVVRVALGRYDSAMTFTIRAAVPEDAATIAPFHVAIWRETYRELAPPDIFSAMDVTLRLKRWQGILADRRRATVLAELDGALAGFGLCGPPGDPVFGALGEIKNLFVGSAFARRGIGRRLMAEMARILERRDHRGIGLGVVVGNEPAVAFYESLGGRKAGVYTDPGPMWRSKNLLYVWDDVAALTRLR